MLQSADLPTDQSYAPALPPGIGVLIPGSKPYNALRTSPRMLTRSAEIKECLQTQELSCHRKARPARV